MKINFYGAAEVVTGSCYLVETNGFKLLIDCGMFQGSKKLKELNYGEFPFDPSSIDTMILTHAHIDHSGLIPKLIKKGFKGTIWATSETVKLCSVLLPDSGHIQETEVERKNRKLTRAGQTLLTPIYTAEDGHASIAQFQSVNYLEKIELTPSISFRLLDAGHILGSAHALIYIQENNITKRIIFSGDIGTTNQPFIEDPTIISDGDVVVMETTYGNRVHNDKANRLEQLAEVINFTYKNGGNLIIPAFAVERTQDLLYYIQKLQLDNKIPKMPIYIDSPLAVRTTRIFESNTTHFDVETQQLIEKGENPLEMSNLYFSETAEQSIALNNIEGGTIIIAASGMADAGRIKHHLKHNLWRSNASVLFVGYQAVGTLGRKLTEGAKEVTIHGERVIVNASIKQIDGMSAHADQSELLAWLSPLGSKVSSIILTHGEPEGIKAFAELIHERFNKVTFTPSLGQSIEIFPDHAVLNQPEPTFQNKLLEMNKEQVNQSVSQSSPEFNLGKVPQKTSLLRQSNPRVRQSIRRINSLYKKLKLDLKRFVENGKRSNNFEYTLQVLKQMDDWINDSNKPKH